MFFVFTRNLDVRTLSLFLGGEQTVKIPGSDSVIVSSNIVSPGPASGEVTRRYFRCVEEERLVRLKIC